MPVESAFGCWFGGSGNTNLDLKKWQKKGRKHFCFFHLVEMSATAVLPLKWWHFFKHTTQSGISFPALREACLERWGGLPPLPQCETIFCSQTSFSSVVLTWLSFTCAVTVCGSFASSHTVIPKFWWESITVSLCGVPPPPPRLFYLWFGGVFLMKRWCMPLPVGKFCSSGCGSGYF